MITREKLKELRNAEKVHAHWIVDDKCVYDDFMKTVEVLWRVADAAEAAFEDYVCREHGCPSDRFDEKCTHNPKYSMKTLSEALAALEGKP